MKNSEKADVFFKVATEFLNLEYCERSDQRQAVVIVNNAHDAVSPYICDCVEEVVNDYKNETILKEEMYASGMKECGFGVWDHVKEGRRQEARWFFLMLMVEFLDNE
jgi:hypothetical protein